MPFDIPSVTVPNDDIIIRPFRLDDAESLAHHANNRKISDMVSSTFPYPYTLDDAISWIEFTNKPSDNVNLAIIIKGQAVGGIGLRKNPLIEDSYELGYWISEDLWGNGMMTSISRAFLSHVTEQKNSTKIVAYILPHNIASKRVLEKLGFKKQEDGEKRVQKDGKELILILYVLEY